MAEFWIPSVEHEKNSDGTEGPIKRVCAWVYDAPDNKWGEKKPYTRADIIALLKYDWARRTYPNVLYTATYNTKEKKWERGAKVRVTEDGKYITTLPTSTTRDNLGELPLCDC